MKETLFNSKFLIFNSQLAGFIFSAVFPVAKSVAIGLQSRTIFCNFLQLFARFLSVLLPIKSAQNHIFRSESRNYAVFFFIVCQVIEIVKCRMINLWNRSSLFSRSINFLTHCPPKTPTVIRFSWATTVLIKQTADTRKSQTAAATPRGTSTTPAATSPSSRNLIPSVWLSIIPNMSMIQTAPSGPTGRSLRQRRTEWAAVKLRNPSRTTTTNTTPIRMRKGTAG